MISIQTARKDHAHFQKLHIERRELWSRALLGAAEGRLERAERAMAAALDARLRTSTRK